MKILIATQRTQGAVPGDYCWALDGEMVTPVSVACAAPERCGCGRGFPGLGSSRATTTALVVERPEIDRLRLRQALSDSLDRQGWFAGLNAAEAGELIDAHVDGIETVCDHFEIGAVVGIRGDSVYIRALTTV